MQKGDADAAIAWLKSIPMRFLPPQVQNETVFAPALGPCHPERQRGILLRFPWLATSDARKIPRCRSG